jgi:hypothetical protein
VDAITTIPSTLLRVKRLAITQTITNPFRNRYRTIGVASYFADGPGIIRSTAITTVPSALLRVVQAITKTITNKLRFWIRYRTVGIIKGAIEAEIAIITMDAITTVPSALLGVVRLEIEITKTITNKFWIRCRTIGIIEVTVEADIAIFAVDAITTIPSTLLRVIRLAITKSITNPFRNRHRTICDI